MKMKSVECSAAGQNQPKKIDREIMELSHRYSSEILSDDEFWTDEYDAIYSKDRRALIKGPDRESYMIHEGTKVICDRAFLHTIHTKRIFVPNTVMVIQPLAFNNACSLEEINIPESVVRIGYGAFDGCRSLRRIEIPKSINKICYRMFYGCSSLIQLSIPDSVTKIDGFAFSGCKKLRKIDIPESVTELGPNPFAGCYKMNIECNSPLYCYENNALFSSDRRTILSYIDYGESTYSIPNTITNIGQFAFLGNETLSHVHIPDSIISIERDAFWECRKLIKIDISSSVKSIGYGAFGWCESLSKVVHPTFRVIRQSCSA